MTIYRKVDTIIKRNSDDGFKIVELEFANRADVLAWRDRVQATRRNLTDHELATAIARGPRA